MIRMRDESRSSDSRLGLPVPDDIPGAPFPSLPPLSLHTHSHERTDHLIPPHSRVEIDAKIIALSSGKQVTEADLFKTVGRTWEETEHYLSVGGDGCGRHFQPFASATWIDASWTKNAPDLSG
ncbi:hypothetical protein DFH09DRAFT_1106813 [Mycena vulgaris]|nr:hypothetical protein DFH09DRAFT_1106813 [Mycena vulgaris]